MRACSGVAIPPWWSPWNGSVAAAVARRGRRRRAGAGPAAATSPAAVARPEPASSWRRREAPPGVGRSRRRPLRCRRGRAGRPRPGQGRGGGVELAGQGQAGGGGDRGVRRRRRGRRAPRPGRRGWRTGRPTVAGQAGVDQPRPVARRRRRPGRRRRSVASTSTRPRWETCSWLDGRASSTTQSSWSTATDPMASGPSRSRDRTNWATGAWAASAGHVGGSRPAGPQVALDGVQAAERLPGDDVGAELVEARGVDRALPARGPGTRRSRPGRRARRRGPLPCSPRPRRPGGRRRRSRTPRSTPGLWAAKARVAAVGRPGGRRGGRRRRCRAVARGRPRLAARPDRSPVRRGSAAVAAAAATATTARVPSDGAPRREAGADGGG